MLIYMMHHGNIGPSFYKWSIFAQNLQIEATEVFFAVTKLFQSRDTGLRRMVYLMIKELSPSADEVKLIVVLFVCLYQLYLWKVLTGL